jgi:phosphate starvation-inducible PhoH-like protein
MQNYIISLIIGTAGTGKTLLAISEGLRALETGLADRLVLIRPLVAVGESLGYLPGDVIEKIAPYSTPLLYYIDEMMQCKGYSLKGIESGVIELVPLALIRGRTFTNSFIILDEAQNTTPEEMHAALTRLGEGSKIVIVGDERQTDLHHKQESGLSDLLDRLHAKRRLSTSSSTNIIEMTKDDIQRNEVLREIHDWYENG